MKHLSLFIFAVLCTGALSAQEITVLDRTTLQPIVRATLYNLQSGASAVTNSQGTARLSDTSPGDTVRVQHLSYETKLLTWSQIEANDYTVLMRERLINTGEVVVSANKWEQDRMDIPVRVTPIQPREVAFQNPQTAADMLAQTGEVFVQKSQMGGGSPVIRGFEANKVLIVVDGVRLNNAIYRSGHLQNVITLEPSELESAEIVFGPGSVIYGSDALGGVMDFHTREPRFAIDEGLRLFGGAFTRYATANMEKTGHAHLNLGFENLASFTSVTYKDFGDLRRGNIVNPFYPDWGKRYEYVERINGQDVVVQNDEPNVQKFTGYSQFNLLQKLRYKPNTEFDIQYGLHLSTSSDVPRYDRLAEYRNGQLRYADWYYGPQNWTMNTLRLNANAQTGFYDHLKLTLAHQMIDEDRISRRFGSPQERHQEEDVTVISVNLDVDKELAPERHRLFYGAEVVLNDVQSEAYNLHIETGERTPEATRYPDGGSTMNTFAAYLSYQWDISEKVLLSAGTRYSYVTLESKLEDKTFYDFPFDEISLTNGALNGSLGLVYRPLPDWQVNANLSSGFRAPNVDDVGKVFDSSPGTVIVPNPDLSPELAYNAELTLLRTMGAMSNVSITGFYTILTDAIVRRDFRFNGQDSILYDGVQSQVQANVNAGEAYLYGGSARFVMDVTSEFSLDGALTYTYGWDKSADVPLGHIPPVYGRARFMYRADRVRSSFEVVYNGWKKIDDYSPSGEDNETEATEFGTPEWFILNARISYQFSRYLQLNLGLENIMDIHYRPFSSGVSAPGRNLILSLRTQF